LASGGSGAGASAPLSCAEAPVSAPAAQAKAIAIRRIANSRSSPPALLFPPQRGASSIPVSAASRQ
jgi:hypothetical protein